MYSSYGIFLHAAGNTVEACEWMPDRVFSQLFALLYEEILPDAILPNKL
jgi:hypothetical protein